MTPAESSECWCFTTKLTTNYMEEKTVNIGGGVLKTTSPGAVVIPLYNHKCA